MSVYSFKEACDLMLTKFELGGKGFGLVEMYKIGIPVPYGFIISTECCRKYFASGRKLSEECKNKVIEKMRELENLTGKKFGNPRNPLLVSVRSGAPFSMPGMMDTILNLGINDEVAEGLATITSNPCFAYETYSRFIRSFGELVFKIKPDDFDEAFKMVKHHSMSESLDESSPEFWKKLIDAYKAVLSKHGFVLPQDPYEQLFKAIAVVFESWWNPRAVVYRKIYKISDDLGTAVVVMQMVYGNLNEKSATGVIFTRNPSNGFKELVGEYLIKAQGDELVSGKRTPRPISELKQIMPGIYKQLEDIAYRLERYFKDIQDIEFTVEDGKLYILQTRNAKRTPQASIKIAVDMVEEGLIDEKEALARIEPFQIKQILHKRISSNISVQPIATGLAASPGVATGKVVLKIEDAVRLKERGESVILVRPETAPEDIVGIMASEGLLTTKGGLTSHAAVVARGFGKPCVVGCEHIIIDFENERLIVGNRQVKKGEVITIDGNTGNVYLGPIPVEEPKISDELRKLLLLSDRIRRLKILAVISDTTTAQKASLLDPDGFLFMNIEDIFVKQMENFLKLLNSDFQNDLIYENVLQFTKDKFKSIFKVLDEKPVYIKLVSRPIKEIIPLKTLGAGELLKKHPQFNFRGIRLLLNMPQFYELQLEAIFKAAIETGKKSNLILLLPYVSTIKEIEVSNEIIKKIVEKIGFTSSYSIGMMLQTIRSFLTFNEISRIVNFVLLDLDELTSLIYSFNRYELRSGIIPEYMKKGVLQYNPYEKMEFNIIEQLYNILCQFKENDVKMGAYTSAPITYELIENIEKWGLDYLAVGVNDLIIAKLISAKVKVMKNVDDRIEHTV
jgi:pyruvate,orthophosphate dikinase